MDKITFSLSPVADGIAHGQKLYRANVQTSGTVGPDELAEALAAKSKQDKSLAQYFLLALNEVLEQKILAGYRVNLGQLSTGFVIKGAFTAENDKFDPKRHSVVPTVQALDPLKSALAAVGADNITVGLTCRLGSLMDFVTKGLNEITGTDEVHIEGERIGIDAENLDEYVRLVKDDGTVAAQATVTASDAQTITCSFPTPPEPGVYTLEVSCRNGNRTSLAPAVARLKGINVKGA